MWSYNTSHATSALTTYVNSDLRSSSSQGTTTGTVIFFGATTTYSTTKISTVVSRVTASESHEIFGGSFAAQGQNSTRGLTAFSSSEATEDSQGTFPGSATVFGTTDTGSTDNLTSFRSTGSNYSTFTGAGTTTVSSLGYTGSIHGFYGGSTSSTTSATSSVLIAGTGPVFNFTSGRTTSAESWLDSAIQPDGITIPSGRTTASQTFSSTGQVFLGVVTYTNTTYSSTSSATISVSTTATRSSIFLTGTTDSATTSGTTTSFTFNTTTTTSSSDPFTTQASSTSTVNFTSYSTTVETFAPFALDTVVQALTTDWPWRITTTGSGEFSNLGTAITSTTFTDQGIVTTNAMTDTYDYSQTATSSLTFTVPIFGNSTISSTIPGTSSFTYLVALQGGVIPFTDTTTATIFNTTTTNATFTFQTFSSRTLASIVRTYIATRTPNSNASTVTTTFTGGTVSTSMSWTLPNIDSTFPVGSSSFESTFGASRTFSSTIENQITTNQFIYRGSSVGHSVTSPSPITHCAVTIGAGFQTPTQLGRGFPIGTNVAAGTDSTVAGVSTAWPTSVLTPVATDPAAVGLDGTVPQTLVWSRTTSKFGGFGWDSTATTTASATQGIHRMTTCDSTTSGTVGTTWSGTSTTYTMTDGQALTAESVPLAASRLSNSHVPFVNYSAFPVS